ncbi:MAG: hypothetical protein IJZ19_03690 [Lentisphaeria bacterium]|nr:hypothetical protein [Lentisphaeria bacterium]
MKSQTHISIKKVFVAAIAASCMLLLNGCAIYDWLCSWIQTAFSSASAYEVSVVNCKNFKVPDQLIAITPKLSTKLSDSMREGVIEINKLPKFANITLADKIPQEEFENFQNTFFTDETTYTQRTEILRNYCDKYKTNIVVWGATMGDDSGMAFIGWMYRRDLDVITTTPAQKISTKMSERVQEHTVKVAIASLLKASLEGRPIGGDGKLADVMIDYKKSILTTTLLTLNLVVRSILSSDGASGGE